MIDATLFLPGERRDARAEYEAEHIPGAVFLDLEEVSDTSNPAPHMMPSEAKFASRMASLGLRDGQRFVVYDNSPLHSAARGWWMLRSFGAHYVAILDGGLQKWKAEGRPLESGRPAVRHGHFSPSLDRRAVADKAEVAGLARRRNATRSSTPAAPAASPARKAEPRAGLASGHIPGSKNLPQGRLFNADNSWKRGDALRAAFDAAGVDLGKPMVATCGSGDHRLRSAVRRPSARQGGSCGSTTAAGRNGAPIRRLPRRRGRREGAAARHQPGPGRPPQGMARPAGQPARPPRLDHPVRQRRRDARRRAGVRQALLRPSRHSDPMGAFRGADRAGAGRGGDDALFVGPRRGDGGAADGAVDGRRAADDGQRLRPDPALLRRLPQALRSRDALLRSDWSAPESPS